MATGPGRLAKIDPASQGLSNLCTRIGETRHVRYDEFNGERDGKLPEARTGVDRYQSLG